MILLLVLKYFSQFVTWDGLAKFFQSPSGMAYVRVQEEISLMKDDNRIEGLDNFVFGINNEAINIVSSLSKQDVKTDVFHIAITVAASHPNDEDQCAETVLQSECLDILTTIREKMRDDVDLKYSIEWLPFPTTISPFVAKDLANSYGWTMELDLKAIDAV